MGAPRARRYFSLSSFAGIARFFRLTDVSRVLLLSYVPCVYLRCAGWSHEIWGRPAPEDLGQDLLGPSPAPGSWGLWRAFVRWAFGAIGPSRENRSGLTCRLLRFCLGLVLGTVMVRAFQLPQPEASITFPPHTPRIYLYNESAIVNTGVKGYHVGFTRRDYCNFRDSGR